MQPNDLHDLFWNCSPYAMMDWRRDGDELILLRQNQQAIAITEGRFEVGDSLTEIAPVVKEGLMRWFLGILDEGVPSCRTFRLGGDIEAFNRCWRNESTPSPCGQFLRMRFQDISLEEVERQRLRQEILTDYLTGVANRRAWGDELRVRCNKGEPFTVVVADLDGFKAANETYGDDFGDAILRELAQRLKQHVCGPHDFVARTGSDEFGLIIDGEADMDILPELIDYPIRLPLEVNESVLYIPSVSIGITAYEPGDEPEQLYLYAREAQARAKRRIDQRDKVLESEGVEPKPWRVCDRSQSYVKLGKAIISEMASPKTLRLNYQPIVDLHTEKIVSYEGLIRWGGGSPLTVLDVVRHHQLGIDFCLWTIEQAQNQWEGWGRPPQHISINVSPDWLHSEVIINALVASEGVGCEITEDALLSSPFVLKALYRLRAGGVHCSWDDFGSRYAVFTDLHNLDIDAVKLDITITRSPTLLKAMVAMFMTLGKGYKLIAEGLETTKQIEYCKELRLYGQGYGLGKPVDGDKVLGFA